MKALFFLILFVILSERFLDSYIHAVLAYGLRQFRPCSLHLYDSYFEHIRSLLTRPGFKTISRQGMRIFCLEALCPKFGILPLAAYGVLSRPYVSTCTELCTLNLLGFHPSSAGKLSRWGITVLMFFIKGHD